MTSASPAAADALVVGLAALRSAGELSGQGGGHDLDEILATSPSRQHRT